VLINRKTSSIDVASDFKKNGDYPVVLVVDDFQISINVIKKHLGNKYVVLESTSGDEALELFDDMYESIDIVILDCIMENTNGLKIYKQMLTKKPKLPVIFISGYTKNDVEKQFGEEINDIFLLKRGYGFRGLFLYTNVDHYNIGDLF
jgi:two-component system cell cycle sensor histidine kinase/response regulator CckA